MKLVGSSGQICRHFTYDGSGTITTGGTAQLIIPESLQRSMFIVQNISDTAMLLEIGGARATATITSGVVTSIAISNAGFGYTIPPRVKFLGGGDSTKNPTYLCPGLPDYMSPSKYASAHAVLTGGAVSSIVIDSGGANYVKAPYVFLQNSEQDPYGCALPSATSGILLGANGGSYYVNGTSTTTDALALYCATTGKAFCLKWML